MAAAKRKGLFLPQEASKRARLLSPFDQAQPCISGSSPPYPAHAGVAAFESNVIHGAYPITPISRSGASSAQPSTPAGPSTLPQDIEYCCFGTLCEVKARMLKNTAALEEACIPATADYMRLQIGHGKNYVLQDSNGLELAVLNQKTADALRILDGMKNIRYEAYVTVQYWTTQITRAKSTATNTVADIEINISGPFDSADEVGRVLSRAGLFLQRPSVLPSGTRYQNPHVIHLPGIQGTSFNPLIPEAPGLADPSARKLDIQAVLSCLDQSGDLTLTAMDERIITTKLQEHQKAAVDFIVQREASTTLPAFSLWKPYENCSQQLCYQHAVLDIKKQYPPRENFGGIIADEMGLGKTLSMLAATCLTAESANRFANGLTGDPMQMKMKATLVIVPSALILQNWALEIEKHCAPGTIECLKYHGPRRPKDPKAILDKNVVLTTYETVCADFVRGDSALYKVAWFRIVLDEAHYICGQQTKRFCATSALQAQHRWCLTGTPIQNRLHDLSALTRFLKVPYLDNAFTFGNYISKPIEHNQSYGLVRLRSLLKSICLRRTAKLLPAPEPTIYVRRLEFTEAERDAYDQVAISHKSAMDEAVSGNRKGNSQLGLCQAILRLRRFCNNGPLAREASASAPQSAEDMFGYLQQTGEAACARCSKELNTVCETEDPDSGAFAACSHFFCHACILQFQPNGTNSCFQCPICGTRSEQYGPEPGHVSQQASLPFNGADSFNTKLIALYHDIIQYQQSEKGIIFTAWKATISVISSLLRATNISHRIVEGSMSIPDRKTSLEEFQSDPNCTILLMTFGTGSAGLNLTAASRIHIIEPQWNPSVESQAIGRAVRLGQKKSVTVVRYIMKNTVEEYMENIQTRKAQLASIGWDAEKGKAADGKLKLVAKMVFDPEMPPDVEMA